MFDKNKIIEVLGDLRFPFDQYCVMTGAALVLYGVKELTADIDLGCKSQLFDLLWANDKRVSVNENERSIQLDGCIEIYENWLPDSMQFIAGIPVADLQWIRQYKLEKGREKDFADIERIDQYLSRK